MNNQSSACEINEQIKKGLAPKSILRAETDHKSGTTHIHFDDKHALYVDGTWKGQNRQLNEKIKNELKSPLQIWLFEAWKSGDYDVNYDLHIDDANEKSSLSQSQWISKGIEYFQEAEILRKKYNIPLILVLRIFLKDRPLNEPIELLDSLVFDDLNDLSPPSLYLFDETTLSEMKSRGKKIDFVFDTTIPHSFSTIYSEYIEKKSDLIVQRSLFLYLEK